MSQDYSRINIYPIIKNFSAVQTWTEVDLPSKGRLVTVGCESADVYVSLEATEGGSTGTVNKLFIKSGGYMMIDMGRGTNNLSRIQIATKTLSSAIVTVIIEEK